MPALVPIRHPLLALALATLLGAPARAAELRPATSLPESQQQLLSDTTARAFDHVRAARGAIGERQSFEARKDLAQASTLLGQARAASPATRVGQEISALQIRLQDPTVAVSAAAFDALFAAIDDAQDREAFGATRRYAERARYFRKDGVAAASELVAAAARIPHGVIDGPLAAAFSDVQLAMIELYGGDLEAADRVLARAERSTLAAVQRAGGAEADWPVDVAAPPPPEAPALEPEAEAETAEEAEPEITESDIPAPSEFQESNGDAPAEASDDPEPPPGA